MNGNTETKQRERERGGANSDGGGADQSGKSGGEEIGGVGERMKNLLISVSVHPHILTLTLQGA